MKICLLLITIVSAISCSNYKSDKENMIQSSSNLLSSKDYEEPSISWRWYDYLCLVCSIAIKKSQIEEVLASGPEAYNSACHLQNGNPWSGACRCGDYTINPWFEHCTDDKKPTQFDLQEFLKHNRENFKQ